MTDAALKYQNRTSKLVHEINDMGFEGYGQAHRLGSREMDMISRFAGTLVDEERAFIKKRLSLVGIDFEAEMEAALQVYARSWLVKRLENMA
jgi:hypothetical protein